MRPIFLIFGIISCFVSSTYAQQNRIIRKTIVDTKQFSSLSDINFYEITYLSDGLKIEAFAAIPKHEEKLPVIVFNRGGNRDFGALQLFQGEYKYPVVYGFSKLAKEGYIVIGCNYRGGGKSEGNDEFGGKDVNDVMSLLEVVTELPEADTSKIGMYGWSRGGMMTFLTLPKTNKVKVAVVGGAPTDKTIIDRPNMETNVYAELIPNYWQNKKEALQKRSACFFVDQFPKNVPILILHGNADWRVKSTQSLKLALELEKFRIPYRLKIFEGASHGIREFRSEVDEEVLFWFNKYLKRGEPLPDMDFHGN